MTDFDAARLRPLSDRILIHIDPPHAKSAGGVILPDRAKEKPRQGKVLAVGPGKLNLETGERTPMMVQAGDRVLIPTWGGDKVAETGEDNYTLLKEDDILAVLDAE